MSKSVFNKISSMIVPLVNPQLLKLILVVGMLLAGLLVPQDVFAGPGSGGLGN